MSKLSKEERLVWLQYHIRGRSNINRVKVNHVGLSEANSAYDFTHERKKAEICINLLRKGHKFITEAEYNQKINGRRVIRDVVDLTTGEVYEIQVKKDNRFLSDPHCDRIIVVQYNPKATYNPKKDWSWFIVKSGAYKKLR